MGKFLKRNKLETYRGKVVRLYKEMCEKLTQTRYRIFSFINLHKPGPELYFLETYLFKQATG